ncbi:MAG: hypothetical protein NTY53_16340, partial [Kiritimatiellaeota bacterium]|nr:hypothetical protein [Kiritimatiellota bacterium]
LADIGQIAGVIAREAGWHGAHAFMVDYPVDHANPEFNKAVRALVAAGKVIGVQALDVVALQTDASGRKLDFSAREEGVAMFRENSPAVGEGKIAETPADYGNGRKPPLPPKVTAAAPAGEPEGSGPQTPQEKLLAKAQADNDRLRAKQREQLKAKKAAQAAGKQAMGAVAKDIGPAVQAASEAAEAATPEERKSKGYAAIGLANRAGKRGILRAGAEAAAGLGAK